MGGKFLAQSIYNMNSGDDGTCHGLNCFRLAHASVAALQLLGVGLGTTLSMRTRKVYRIISDNAVENHDTGATHLHNSEGCHGSTAENLWPPIASWRPARLS